ncbi:MAG TPA: hypothetical protein VEA16_21590 [Vicinamibacterales bacterium]|nr:hypothetical protein [Vicinamibacterales bacterium]
MTRHAGRAVVCAMVLLSAASAAAPTIQTAAFKADVDGFFDREVASHFLQIPESGPLPERVHGALTTGEFSWGTFVRALAAYADTRHTRTVGGRDVIPLIGRVGVIESVNGSKAFAQLYAALALRHFGADLSRNALWQSLSADDRIRWRALLDPTRFYDPQTRRVIDLPENYLGVASRVATLSFQMGVITDRAFVDALLDRAAEPFTRGALYADDAGTAGRYDRYSNEYARYVYEAAETVNRQDILTALKPSLLAQSRLWWDLVSTDGYGYNWGRSLGVVSYLDTLEIVAFLAQQPELRPAPIADLASEYRLAWMWLRDNYDTDRHMLQVFAPGRGNYAYITKQREWQQNVGFFGKALMAHDTLMRVLAAEKISVFPARPNLPAVARFEYFRRGDRAAGVWLVRQGALRFALPITSGTRPGVADYLPAPHGLAGFVAPVEQQVPAGAPYLELADGRIIVPADGADAITPGRDGRSLTATWRRFALVGGQTGVFVEPGFMLSRQWRIDGATLVATETITAASDMSIRKMSWLLPSSAVRHSSAGRILHLSGPDGALSIETAGDLPLASSIRTIGDEPLGRGPRVPVPTHVWFEATDLELRAGRPRQWEIRLTATAPTERQ